MTKPSTWFLPVASLALAWNLIGVAAFFGQMTTDPNTLPQAQRDFYESTPIWATGAFALAVFAGTLGSLGLLLRKRWAVPALVASCVGIVVQMAHSLLLGQGLAVFGATALVLPLATLAIGAALIWLAMYSQRRDWI